MTDVPHNSGSGFIPEPGTLKLQAEALLSVVAVDRPAIAEHSVRVTRWAKKLGDLCGLADLEMEELECAAMLHDMVLRPPPAKVNMGFIDDRVVDRRVLDHLALGFSILSRLPAYENIARAVRYHHERYDGMGVPEKLADEDIPLAARIIAIADVFDLEYSSKLASKTADLELTRKHLSEQRGITLDPILTNRFLFIISTDDELNTHGAGVAEIPFSALRPGMVLSRDLRAIDGTVLLRAGVQLNQAVLDRAFSSNNLEWLLTTAHVLAKSIDTSFHHSS